MTELRIQNVVTQVHNAPDHVNRALSARLAFQPSGYFYAPSYKSGAWDGWKRLYLPPTYQRPFGKFWTGLAYRASVLLEELNEPYAVIDERVKPPQGAAWPIALPDTHKTRYYQDGAIEAAYTRSRGIVRVPTGGGKTLTAAALMAKINQPSIFVVHTLSLLNQALDDFKTYLKAPIGVIQGEHRELQKFNVATIQTINSILWSATDTSIQDFVENMCALLMVDEAQHSRSDIWQKNIQRFTNAYYRIALSATPHKHDDPMGQNDDMLVEALFGRVIYSVERNTLQKEGYLTKAHIFYI